IFHSLDKQEKEKIISQIEHKIAFLCYKIIMEKRIDVNFDFTTDTPQYWDNYWKNDMGGSFVDPDSKSKTLKKYHKIIWSKQLPNGEFMNLTEGEGRNYLTWKEFRFGSDSIIASFRYNKYRDMIKKLWTICRAIIKNL
ncbi:MAG: DUF6994 family protein, partial [Christensenellales bacterium]